MPTLYFPCPQCERPLDADPALDGPTVQCPCCDRVVEIPHPKAFGRPVLIWLAALGLVLVPASWAPALLDLLPDEFAWGLVGGGSMAFVVPAVGLLRGTRVAWIVALVLALFSLCGSIGGSLVLLPFVFAMGMGPMTFVDAAVPVVLAAALSVLLLLPSCRAWCDR